MTNNYFSPDITEFLFLLARHKVKYLIVGGEAVIFYGHARLTGDIDVYYFNDNKNVKLLYNALLEFWNGNIPGMNNADELRVDGMVFQFGVPPNRIDLMNSIENVKFNTAWKNRKDVRILHKKTTFSIHYIGLDSLIKNKEAVNRYRDKDDLQFLKALKRNKN
jgi:hypothetical protein